MYWFLAGILTGIALSFFYRKLVESELFNLVLLAARCPLKALTFRPAGTTAADGRAEPTREQRKAVAAQ
jgi:hypothetical protein